MAGGGSQLKKLKASLKTAGIIGQPQLSKKAKKRQREQNAKGKPDSRLDRETALESIRAEFNPFDIKKTKQKYDISGRGKIKGAQGNPALSKQAGEESRRNTLLVEMKKRNRAGEIIDRRFGENDPSMAPEDKMLERFTKERQRRSRNAEIFNLEDDDILTHYGQSLGAAAPDTSMLDDFQEKDLGGSSDDDDFMTRRKETRVIPIANGGNEDESDSGEEGQPAKKKSKAEVMKEVIMKSKFHKYERQKQKDEDEDVREELDAELDEIRNLLSTIKPAAKPAQPISYTAGLSGINPDRLQRLEKELDVDAKYDVAVREMTFDRRSKPAERTKTAEELAQEKAEKLQKLERKRLKRMRSEEDSSDEKSSQDEDEKGTDAEEGEEEDEFGLGKGIGLADEEREFVHGDEESASDSESDSSDEKSDDGPKTNGLSKAKINGVKKFADVDGDMDDPNLEFDFQSGSEAESDLEDDEESEGEEATANTNEDDLIKEVETKAGSDTLAFTYPCPGSHSEFVKILSGVKTEDIPLVVQRIRVLHHPSLHPDNKGKLEKFVPILLQHILHLSNNISPIPFLVIETLTRHLHSMSKQYPKASAIAFREHIVRINSEISESSEDRHRSDLILFTAIGTIFSTSDLFHEVVTPGLLVICKYLASNPPVDMPSLATGTYYVTLCNKYQRLSKRVIPEAINFISQALHVMAPEGKSRKAPGCFPDHALSAESISELRIAKDAKSVSTSLSFNKLFTEPSDKLEKSMLPTLAKTHFHLLSNLAKMHAGKPAFIELFGHFPSLLKSFSKVPCLASAASDTLSILDEKLKHAQRSRRPLELHHHRPLAIPLNDPMFDDDYRPGQRMDKDADRRELAKLKALHNKERKGAIRELRKDAAFVAREQLREKKEADREYHDKMLKLQRSIQAEEGAAANEYEREKRRKK